MDYYVFVLGYDLLHEDLDGIESDVAYKICITVILDFLRSEYSSLECSTYTALNRYLREHIDEIKAMIEAER